MTELTVGTEVCYPDGHNRGMVIAVILTMRSRPKDRVWVRMADGTIYAEIADKLVRANRQEAGK